MFYVYSYSSLLCYRLSEKPKMPEKVSEQCSKVVEDFIDRIRKLESDFLRCLSIILFIFRFI